LIKNSGCDLLNLDAGNIVRAEVKTSENAVLIVKTVISYQEFPLPEIYPNAQVFLYNFNFYRPDRDRLCSKAYAQSKER
jgi:hypothetical protein